MARPALDARNKAQQIWPGATVAERGKGFIRHQHPTDPARYMYDTQVGGRWHFGAGPYSEATEIDTSWQPSAGAWDWEVVANDFFSYVRDSVPVSYRYVDASTSHFVELTVNAIQWVNDEGQSETAASFQQVTPTIDDDEITWTDIAPGWDVSIEAQTGRLAKWLRIDSLANLGAPTIGGTNPRLRLRFSFQKSNGLQVYVNGALWNEQNNTWAETNGDIEFRNSADGQAVFWYKRPTTSDADGEQTIPTQRVRRTGANFYSEIDIPWTWLQSANYPIEIDPTVDEQVGAGNGDGQESQNDVSFNSTNTTFYCQAAVASIDRYDGLAQFTTVAVDGTINVAYGSVYASNNSFKSMDADVHMEDEDSANDLTTEADIVNRTRTSASTSWIATLTFDAFNNTPSIVTAVQEVVDRPGWSSGNNMALYFRAHTTGSSISCEMRSYDGSTTNAPKLHIEYTESTKTVAETALGTDEITILTSILGTTVWGHVTGVTEDNVRTFAVNWTGTGNVISSGDNEKLELDSGEYMVSEMVETGSETVTLLQNEYGSGDDVLMEYRHGATQSDCQSASWNTYSAPFASLGFVQIRMTSTL